MSRVFMYILLLSMVLGFVCGIYYPSILLHLKPIGMLFINLMKLFALPLIVSALIVALGDLLHSNHDTISLLSVVLYMLVSEIIAVSIGLTLFNLVHPGQSVHFNLLSSAGSSVTHIKHPVHYTIGSLLSLFISGNIFESLAKFKLVPIVIFCVIFGIACSSVGKGTEIIVDFFRAVRNVSQKCLEWVMLLSPIGIFVLIGVGASNAVSNGGIYKLILGLVSFVVLLLIAFFIHFLWQFLLVVIIGRVNPVKFFRQVIDVWVMAFASSSSIVTLPTAINAVKNITPNNRILDFMLPLSASINIGGYMLYEISAVLFFTQILGVHLSFLTQIIIGLLCIIVGVSASGIPEASLVSLVIVFKMVSIPLSAISLLLPIDRVIDRLRTMLNIFGNVCGTIVVDKLLARFNKDYAANGD